MPLAFLLVATAPAGQSLPSQNTIVAAQTPSQDGLQQFETTIGSIIQGPGHSEQASPSGRQQVATLDPDLLRRTSLSIASMVPGQSPALVPGQSPALVLGQFPDRATSNTGLPALNSLAASAPDVHQPIGPNWHGSIGEEVTGAETSTPDAHQPLGTSWHGLMSEEDTGAETRPANGASGGADPNFCRNRLGFFPDPASQQCWYICTVGASDYRCCSSGYGYFAPTLVYPYGACLVRSSGLVFSLFTHPSFVECREETKQTSENKQKKRRLNCWKKR
jgi:hypothetical protein